VNRRCHQHRRARDDSLIGEQRRRGHARHGGGWRNDPKRVGTPIGDLCAGVGARQQPFQRPGASAEERVAPGQAEIMGRTRRRHFQYLKLMRFTQDTGASANLVRGYGNGELRINDDIYRSAIIVSASKLRAAPDIGSVEDLARLDPSRILEFDPELILVGTGQRQIFPAAAFRAQFLSAGIGIEVMDTGAACRTFNVLVAEQRPVVALLML
jgi:uncharacterized protein